MVTFNLVKRQEGATLIVVLMLLVIITLLALSIAASTTSRSLIVTNNVLKAQSIEAAETGSNVLLILLKEGLDANSIASCNNSYSNQFNGDGSQTTEITSSSDDKRAVNLAWYACKPSGSTDVCNSSTLSGCFSVVITGVACYGNVNDPSADTCTVSRYLQGYAKKK